MIRKALVLFILMLPLAWGQHHWPGSCPGGSCQTQVAFLPATDSLSVNTVNGSVSVETWSGSEIMVRTEVHGTGQVTVQFSPGNVSVRGPSANGIQVKIEVPPFTGLTIATVNGGIAIHGVAGPIVFNAVNGEASLYGVTGDVTGNAVNGGISIAAGGAHWAGQTLAVDTVDGDIEITVPADCAAHVTASAMSGTIDTDFPVDIPDGSKHVSFDLGTPGSSAITMSATKGNVQLLW